MENTIQNDNQKNINVDKQDKIQNLITDIIFLNSIPVWLLLIASFVVNWLGMSFRQTLFSEKWLLIALIIVWIYFLFTLIYLIFRKYNYKVIISSIIQTFLVLFIEIFAVIFLLLWINNVYSSVETTKKLSVGFVELNKILKQDKNEIKQLKEQLKSCQVNTWNEVEK